MNDRHKSRDTGPAWSLAGMIHLAARALACYLVYVIWVP